MVRIVLDTNVLVSAVLNPEGIPGRILRLVSENAVRLILSPAVLAEYRNVLGRKKFGLTSSTAAAIVGSLEKLAIEVVPSGSLRACKDPSDDKFVECAAASGANYIVTGNGRHFPRSFGGTRIVSPSELLRRLG